MQYLDFNELYQADYDLDDLFVMNQNWQDGDFFSTIGAPRKTSALLYFANCDAIYTFPDKTELHVLKNSLIYIPQHSEYKTRFINSQTPPATILIEFCAKMHNAPFCSAHSVTVLENETPLEIKKTDRENGGALFLTDNLLSAFKIRAIFHSGIFEQCTPQEKHIS